ncbi:MAG: hypothetical protein WC831_02390 [Parcubacteria group bacterium]|jgi:hypothetical protein
MLSLENNTSLRLNLAKDSASIFLQVFTEASNSFLYHIAPVFFGQARGENIISPLKNGASTIGNAPSFFFGLVARKPSIGRE